MSMTFGPILDKIPPQQTTKKNEQEGATKVLQQLDNSVGCQPDLR